MPPPLRELHQRRPVEFAQRHEIARLDVFLRLARRIAVEPDAIEDAVHDARVVDVEVRVAQADLIERLDCHEQRLGVRIDSGRADQLHAGLRQLAHAAFLRLLIIAEHGRDICEPERQRRFAHPRRDEARDRRGHLRPQRERGRTPVVELKEQVRGLLTEPALDHVEPLDDGRLHLFIRPAPEHGAHLLLDLTLARKLVRHPVPNAGGESHGAPSRTFGSPTIATRRSRTRRSGATPRSTVEPLMCSTSGVVPVHSEIRTAS